MKRYLGILLLVVLATSGTAQADSEASFLKVGNWYVVSASKGESFPNSSPDSMNFTSELVKILKIAANQWCWVEYDVVTTPGDNKGQVVVKIEKTWLNFAQLTTVDPTTPPYYQYYKQQYAGGVKIVPYQGQEP